MLSDLIKLDTAFLYQIVLYTAVVTGLIFRRGILNSFPHILYLVSLTGVVETIGFISIKVYSKAASNLYDVFQPFELVLLGLYFMNAFSSKKYKFLTKLLVSGGIILLISYHILRFSFPIKAYYDFLIVAFIVSVLAILYLVEVLKVHLDKDLFNFPHFWISTGVLVFHSGTFILMGCVVYIYSRNAELAAKLYSINHILNIIYYGLITYAFYVQWKLTKSSLSS